MIIIIKSTRDEQYTLQNILLQLSMKVLEGTKAYQT